VRVSMDASIEASFAAAAVQWAPGVSMLAAAEADFEPEHCAFAAKPTAPENASNKNNFFMIRF